MPNWCNNNLILEHDDPQMIQRAFDALERGEFLNEFIPVPQDLKDTVSGFHGDPEKQRELEEQTARNVAKYGAGNWYDFCVNEWGTKWDCGEQGASDIHPEGRMLHTSFDTAWAPPIAAYEKLEAMGFRVEAMYYESGMGFAGTYEDGCDDGAELEGLSASDVEREYPDLNECFGIADSMREYEEDEELTEWIKEGVEARKESTE
jgi:hypothetical protein